MSGVQISLPRPIFDFLIDNRSMVTVAQLVEPRTVTPVVAGSNPVSHPSLFYNSFHDSDVFAWQHPFGIWLT